MHSEIGLAPKSGKLRVLVICRISTINQDVRSLSAQEEMCKKFVRERFEGEIEFTVIATQGSGERLDRAELAQAEEDVESDTVDVVVAEDLGRIMRRARAVDFCELCEDHGARLFAINDGIDTGQKKWRRNALWSAMKHEESNEDTSDRIKRQMDANFQKDGGCVNNVVWGIDKPRGCKNDTELRWMPMARKILKAAFWKIEKQPHLSIAAVARWARGMGGEDLTAVKFGQLLRNPIVTGMRQRGMKRSRRLNKTGARRGVAAPTNTVLTRFCPNLKIISSERFERIGRMLAQRNSVFKRGADGVDPLKGRPKADTRFPGQILTCGVCGRFFRWGGHGQSHHLMCAGVHDRLCWNTTTVDGPLAARLIAKAVIGHVMAIPGFDNEFGNMIQSRALGAEAMRNSKLKELAAQERRIVQEAGNVMQSLRRSPDNGLLQDEIDRIAKERSAVQIELQELNRNTIRPVVLPPFDELRAVIVREFEKLIDRNTKAGALIRGLMPHVELHPYRLIDSHRIVHRAEIELSLLPLIPGTAALAGSDGIMRHRLTVDLFIPPQRELIRSDVQTAMGRMTSLTQKKIARELNPKFGFVTDTAVSHAFKLTKKMQAAGLLVPYVHVTGPHEGSTRNRVHLHPDYHFQSLPGFVARFPRKSVSIVGSASPEIVPPPERRSA